MDELLRQTTAADVPSMVNGEPVFTDLVEEQRMPVRHSQVLCRFHRADKKLTRAAIEGAVEARARWSREPMEQRARVFLKAADLLASDRYRYRVMAATMLGQGKNAWQAEIDAAAEMADFWRFNVRFAMEDLPGLLQPTGHAPGTWNRAVLRALEGFVMAISPFNFTAIGGNLPSAPAIMGNAVLWKPSSNAVFSNYLLWQILEEAGLPPGVIQFLPGRPGDIVETALGDRRLAGVHFTGGTAVFREIFRTIGRNVANYDSIPRLVGETGGKNFHLAHASADRLSLLHQTIRAAFEYQGQKCSACSRLYLPRSMWEGSRKRAADGASEGEGEGDLFTPASDTLPLRDLFVEEIGRLSMAAGPEDLLSAFSGPLISREAVDRVAGYIDRARHSPRYSVLVGGEVDVSTGWNVRPCLIEAKEPAGELFKEEIFGPVLVVYPYPDDMDWRLLLELINASPYGLTGSVFAEDREALMTAESVLRDAVGNLYLNDKSTGAVVGHQAFGGARASGTNDKAGSPLNLLRWTSPQVVKEALLPLEHWSYPSNQAE